MRGRPVEPEARARTLELFAETDAEGQPLGRNEIARRLLAEGHELSAATVTAIAKEERHVFDRSATYLAVQARTIDLQKIRTELAGMFLIRAHEALVDLDAPTELVHFSAGTDQRSPSFERTVLDAPTIADRRNLMATAGIAVQRSAELSRAESGHGVPEGRSVLAGLAADLQRVADALDDVDPTAVPEA